MKKNYMKPEMQVYKFETKNHLLQMSSVEVKRGYYGEDDGYGDYEDL